MDFYKLSKTVLFQGATPEETEQMLSCLKAGKRKYKKEEMIYRAGEVVSCVGVVLSGSVLIENDDIWGNRSVLERAGEGEIFAETYASPENVSQCHCCRRYRNFIFKCGKNASHLL